MRALGVDFLDQCLQSIAIGTGLLVAESLEGALLGEQAFAPALDQMQSSLLGARWVGPLPEPVADGPGIDFAHQPADELQLAATRLVLRDAPRRMERFDQLLG